jgi:hypothetical protein
MNRWQQDWVLFGVGTLICAGAIGCANDGRVGVVGNVTLDGKPLDTAAISFRPAPGHTGPTAGGQVNKGVFQIDAQHGLLPGKYLVVVQAFRNTGRMVNDPQRGKQVPEQVRVAVRENRKLEVEIGTATENRLDLQLTSVGDGK